MSFNRLTDAEAERLAILAEECSEVIQVVGKILRHGYDSYNPFDDKRTTNRNLLEKELGDLSYATLLMRRNKDIDVDNITVAFEKKTINIEKYLHHN